VENVLDILMFVIVIQIVIWFMWSRFKGQKHMASFPEVIVISLLIIIWGLLSILNMVVQAQYAITLMVFIAVAGAFIRVIRRKREVPFNVFIRELFVEEYGFKGFVYLLASGVLLFAITAFAYKLTELPLFVYIFGLTGIAAVIIGFCGMLYGMVRFYMPIILDSFKKEKK
jgi:hypothetical protein